MAVALTAAGLALTAMWFVVQLKEWQRMGHDYFYLVLNVIVTVALWAVLCVASIAYVVAARRARTDITEVRQRYEKEIDELKTEATAVQQKLAGAAAPNLMLPVSSDRQRKQIPDPGAKPDYAETQGPALRK